MKPPPPPKPQRERRTKEKQKNKKRKGKLDGKKNELIRPLNAQNHCTPCHTLSTPLRKSGEILVSIYEVNHPISIYKFQQISLYYSPPQRNLGVIEQRALRLLERDIFPGFGYF